MVRVFLLMSMGCSQTPYSPVRQMADAFDLLFMTALSVLFTFVQTNSIVSLVGFDPLQMYNMAVSSRYHSQSMCFIVPNLNNNEFFFLLIFFSGYCLRYRVFKD
jgi:hypothetical protein